MSPESKKGYQIRSDVMSLTGKKPTFRKRGKLIYIAGYGRTGSTLLEAILSWYPGVFGLGEFAYFFPAVAQKHVTCSCGNPVLQCPFWKSVLKKVIDVEHISKKRPGRIRFQLEGIGLGGVYSWRWLRRSKRVEGYKRELGRLYDAVWECVPDGTEVLIDSSKTSYSSAFRPRFLYELYKENLKVIHIVRDVRGVFYSMKKRGLRRPSHFKAKNKGRILGFRALIGWAFANLAAEGTRRYIPDRQYHLLRYEELVSKAEETLSTIGQFLGLDDISSLIEILLSNGLNGRERHQIMGNPMRFEKKIRIRPDMEWVQNLSSFEKSLCKLVGGRMSGKYGYRL